MTATWRDAFIDACATLALLLVAITEALSLFGALNRLNVALAWGFVLFALVGWHVRNGTRLAVLIPPKKFDISREDKLYFAVFSLGGAVTLYLAIVAAPSALDALGYHLPRVLRWVQDGTVSPFVTHVPRQIWIGPGWEYFQLHLQLFAGTDAVANLLQWLALLASPVVVSVLARELGATHSGQMFAALFTISIPMGITQASGSQVDLFAAFWLACSVALLLRLGRKGAVASSTWDAILFGAAAGMAVMAKATNALFLAPFVVWVAAGLLKPNGLRLGRLAVTAFLVAAMINSGPMLRNRLIFGSLLGPPSRGGVANEIFTPSALASNVIRNAAIHLNTPSRKLNLILLDAITETHRLLGIDVHDPLTTYELGSFTIPLDQDDEGIASNQFHFLLIVSVAIWLLVRSRDSRTTGYMLCVLAGALIFCLYLKWQPWHSRLHLPLFVIAAAAAAAALEQALPSNRLRLVAVGLVLIAIPPTIRNAWRPIVSRHAIFTMPYERRLFPHSPNDYETFSGAADFIASQRCRKIGIIGDGSMIEYPLWKMVQRRLGKPLEIRHVGVLNPTRVAATQRDKSFRPCAVVQLYHLSPEALPPDKLKREFPYGVPFRPENMISAWVKDRITVYVPVKA